MRHIKALGTKMGEQKPQTAPHLPPIQHCVPRGMIGYEELKRRQNLEAWRDREASKVDCSAEIRRLAFIAKLKKAFVYIDVQWIADQIDPWNMDEFKRLVAEAHLRYLRGNKEPVTQSDLHVGKDPNQAG